MAEAVPTKTTLRSDHGKEFRRQHQAELAGGGAGVGDNRSAQRSLLL
ncbi:hypothetical protein SOVF_010600, partial [Spinacia oleracea]